MSRLFPRLWYRQQAVLTALSVNEQILAQDRRVHPVWGPVLFRGLLGLDPEREGGELAINPLAFPVSVRRRLRVLADNSIITSWANADYQINRGDAHVRTAKLIATLLHSRDVPPRSLWKLANYFLSHAGLPDADQAVDPLRSLAAKLSRPGPREAKLRAVTEFAAAVPELIDAWPALVLALAQPLLDWVPVAMECSTDALQQPGVMVPFYVDLLPPCDELPPCTVENSLQADVSKIKESLERARFAAISAWRGRYGHLPEHWVNAGSSSRVVLDFQLLEGILAEVYGTGIEVEHSFNLQGRSLELPLALAIYGGLTGSPLSRDVRASGVIGRFRPDPQDNTKGNHDIITVAGEASKAVAAEVHLADRLILPSGFSSQNGVATDHAPTFMAAIDYTFGGEGHRFVRAADVAEDFKRRSFSAAEVDQILEEMLSPGPVKLINEPLGQIVQTLFEVNARLGSVSRLGKGRYTVVRLAETERADAAWASIWYAIDGDGSDFSRFISATSFHERARLFAAQMSRCAPRLDDPRTAPHILVIAGFPKERRNSGLSGGRHGRFDLGRIMKEVSRNFLPISSSPAGPGLQSLIGATRIILVPDAQMPTEADIECNPCPDGELLAVAQRLSAFRYGFSFEMARRLLGEPEVPMPAEECFSFLERLREYKVDGKPLLAIGSTNRFRVKQAPTAFEFMLRRRYLSGLEDVDLIELHERCALAIAPMLHAAQPDAHVGIRDSFAAPWVDEAYFQLSRAREVALTLKHRSGGTKAREFGKRALSIDTKRKFLFRASGLFLIERLFSTMGARGNIEVYDDFVERMPGFYHPSIHALQAALATMVGAHEDDLGERQRLFDAAARHLERGQKQCVRLKPREEKLGCMFLIASERCRLAFEQLSAGPSADAEKAFQDASSSAVDLLDHVREIYWPAFFSTVGDSIPDSMVARNVYRSALWNPSMSERGIDDWALVGWAGTLLDSETIHPDMLNKIKAHLTDRFFERVESMMRQDLNTSQRRRAGLARLQRVRDRMTERPRRKAGPFFLGQR